MTTPITDPDRLRTLLYTSSAAAPVTDAMLERIQDSALRNNEPTGITGFLLADDDGFLQFLEGPADEVDTLLGNIQDDPAHRDVEVLLKGWSDTRCCPAWSMGVFRVESLETEYDTGHMQDIREVALAYPSLPTEVAEALRGIADAPDSAAA